MRLFISWSGEQSKQIAEHIHRWMPRVIQAIQPYISSNDIEKGARWASDLAAQLDQTDFGIVCLVPENIEAPWIQFEAGALSKSLERGKVAPILFGLDQVKLAENPLVQFQCTQFLKGDILQLMQTINRSGGIELVKADILEDAFEKSWPALDDAIGSIVSRTVQAKRQDPTQAHLDKVFGEITALAREQMKGLRAVEEKLSVLIPQDVRLNDVIVQMSVFDALLEFSVYAQKAIADIYAAMSPTDDRSLGRLEGLKLGTERLHAGAKRAVDGGCSIIAGK